MDYKEAVRRIKTHMRVHRDQEERAIYITEALQMAIAASEKQIPMKPNHVRIEHGKHTWSRDEQGNIDEYAWENDYHHGVFCKVCGETICVLCDEEYDDKEDCIEEHYDCPVCDEKHSRYSKPSYCNKCGQKLDWN